MNHFDSWWRCIHHFIICTCAKLLKTSDRLGSAQCLQYIPLYCQASRILQQSPTAGLWISYSKGISTQQAQPFFLPQTCLRLASGKINVRFLGLRLRLLPSCKNGNGKRLLSTEIRWSKPGSAKFEVHLIRAGANRSAACKWQLQIYFVPWMTCIYAAKIYSPIITPPPLWLHKKSLPWWVFSARSDKSSVAGAYILHLRKILRLLPLAVNQQSWHLDLSKSARPNVKYDFEFFTLWVSVL